MGIGVSFIVKVKHGGFNKGISVIPVLRILTL